MRSELLTWTDRPSDATGIHFADDDGSWHLTTYAQLANGARRIASWLVERGLSPGGRVAMVMATSEDFVAAYFGVLLAGGTPCLIAPPSAFRPERYVAHVAEIFGSLTPDLIVVDESVLALASEAAENVGYADRVTTLGKHDGAFERNPAQLALLQLTSGSSGSPRPVRVPFECLDANIHMIKRSMGMRPNDVTATWLPTYHDMGLIGCLLTPIVCQTTIRLMRPEQFIRRPTRWLACFGELDATASACPNFGFDFVARRVKARQIEHMNFSKWRVAIVGAEHVDPGALRRFSALTGPLGFAQKTFMPAYGMAEATLAVTGGAMDEVSEAVRLDWSALRVGDRVVVADIAHLGDDKCADGVGWLVGCGQPHPEIEVRIGQRHASTGDEEPTYDILPDEHLGEIMVSGPSVTPGYLHATDNKRTSIKDGWLRTGDAGFLRGGELYVLGRIGDAIKVRGRPVYVEDLEVKVSTVAGLKKGRFAVLAGRRDDANHVVIIHEGKSVGWIDAAVARLQEEVGTDLRISIYTCGAGVIQRTSSGKPRRRVMWEALVEGRLEVQLVFETPLGTPEAAA